MSAPWLVPFGELVETVRGLMRDVRTELAEVRATSVAGPAGPAGERGPDGTAGPPGPQGTAGERGEKGDPGPQGERGTDGVPGAKGDPGERGLPGDKGLDGVPGRDGRDGAPGQKGDPGRDGKDGAPGRDGISREEFAAALATETEKAVAAVLAGISIDGRTLKLGERSFRLPVVIYRGVYVEGRLYEHGDQVTWAGSQWHANEDTESKPGDGNPAWTLAAKKGRDGRDGKDAVVRAPQPVKVGG